MSDDPFGIIEVGDLSLPEIPAETHSELGLDPTIKAMPPGHPVRDQHERERDAELPLEERLEVIPFYFVIARDKSGVPYKIGNLYDMGPGKVGKSFPKFKPLEGFLTEEEAEHLRGRLVEYIQDIKALPEKKRPGSSRFW